MNAALMALVRASRRSWWSLDYGRRQVHEWDTVPAKIRTPLSVDGSRSLWEETNKKGVERALLCCPDGVVGAVNNPADDTLFQFKVAFADFGLAGPVGSSRGWCHAHVLGAVINPEGDCRCYAWEPGHWRMVNFTDNIWDFQYQKLGKLAVTETFQLQGV